MISLTAIAIVMALGWTIHAAWKALAHATATLAHPHESEEALR